MLTANQNLVNDMDVKQTTMKQKENNDIYRVVMDGYMLADTDKSQVVQKLKRLFGTSEEKIKAMFDGQPTVIKTQLSKSKAYQYVRTISHAGAACHIDKLNNIMPEETSQIPVHVERSDLLPEFDPLGKVKKRLRERNDFSDVMRQEIQELEQVRKRSDLIITSLFIVLLLIVLIAALFLYLF
jgi:ribosomal protein L7/L12